MKSRKIRLSLRTDMKNKADETARMRTGKGWENTEITVEEFMTHIGKGFLFAHQFIDGRRSKQNFYRTDILVADIDQGMTFEEAQKHVFVKSHATFLYTTPSHREDAHRFRIVFVLDRTIFEGENYEALYRSLLTKIPTDPAVKSCAQFFFGNSDVKLVLLGGSIDENTINDMITQDKQRTFEKHSPKKAAALAYDVNVKTKSNGIRELRSLEANVSIFCPFGTHIDRHPSAFVKVNKNGERGVECRACRHEAWSGQLHSGSNFDMFDKLVREHADLANAPAIWEGLSKLLGVETNFSTRFNFSLSNDPTLPWISTNPGVHLIKSAKGTGKTHQLANLVDQFKNPKFRRKNKLKDRLVLIGHRQTLMRESAAKLGLECYLDTKGYDGSYESRRMQEIIQKPMFYAVCLDSLHSRIVVPREKYDVVIIDESEQVFSHFLSNHMKHPTENFSILQRLLQKAKYVYCLDADIDSITLTGVMACLADIPDSMEKLGEERHKPNFFCYLNEFQKPQQSLEVYTGKNDLLDALRLDISAGRRCYITSNNKKFIVGQFEVFSNVHKNKKFKLVVSDMGDDDDTRAFLKNIKEEILNYDAVWSSPSIGTGIDITFPNDEQLIDCVYGFFDGGINTHFDIDQQLGRVRHPNEVRVWVSPKMERRPTSKEEILTELVRGDNIEGLKYYLNQFGAHVSPAEIPIMSLLAEVISMRRRSINKFRYNFITHKERTGWLVKYVGANASTTENGSIVGAAGRAQRWKAIFKRLLSAEDISSEEASQIIMKKEQNQPVTETEKSNSERYWVKKFYRSEISKELIVFDDDGKTRQKIRLLEAITNPGRKYRKFEDIKNPDFIDPNIRPALDLPLLEQMVFMRELLARVGILDLDTFQLKPDQTYAAYNIHGFILFLKMHRERLLRLFDKDLNDHIEYRPLSQVGSILRLVGLKQTVERANKGGNVGGATYRLNKKKYKQIFDIINRRASSRSSKSALGAVNEQEWGNYRAGQ